MKNLKIDKKIITDLLEQNIFKVLLHFYNAGCSGLKLDLITNFSEDENIEKIYETEKIEFFCEKKYGEKLENASIMKLVKKSENPHLAGNKPKYIFHNSNVLERCGCGTSFNFEKKKPKINLGKLGDLKSRFQNS